MTLRRVYLIMFLIVTSIRENNGYNPELWLETDQKLQFQRSCSLLGDASSCLLRARSVKSYMRRPFTVFVSAIVYIFLYAQQMVACFWWIIFHVITWSKIELLTQENVYSSLMCYFNPFFVPSYIPKNILNTLLCQNYKKEW